MKKYLLSFILVCAGFIQADAHALLSTLPDIANRVKVTTTSTGTGTVSLGAAYDASYQTFLTVWPAGASNIPYTYFDPTTGEWEMGYGSYNAGTNVFTRTTVTSNSAHTEPSKINFAAGTKVFSVNINAEIFQLFGDAVTAGKLNQFASTSSAELFGVISDETGGSGVLVGSAGPTLTGNTTVGTINKYTLTAPATGATITIADGKTLTVSNDTTVSGTNTGDQTITLSGDVSGSGTAGITVAIGANKVTNAMIRQSGALAVVGRSANSTGNVADIQATAASDAVLRESGSVIGFGTIATGGIANLAVTNAKIANSTIDLTSKVTGILPSANGGTANGFTKFTGPTTAEKTFTLPDASTTILTTNAAVTVAQGGTGITSGTSGGIPYFSAAGTIASSGALAANQIVLGGGAGTTPATLGSLGTTTTVLHGNAAGAPSFGAIVNSDITNGTIDLTTKVTGLLPAANGGIGIDGSAAANGKVPIGNGSGYTLATITAGQNITVTNGAGSITIASTGGSSSYPQDYIAGLTPSWTSTTVIGVSNGGNCRDSTNAADITLSGAFTKGTGSWVAGTGNGGLDTGTISSSSAYHWYVIKKASDGTGDLLFSLSATSPTMPSGYTYFRRIFSMKTNGSTQWTKFYSRNIGTSVMIQWDVPVEDINVTNPGTSAVLRTLSVPTGITVRPFFRAQSTNVSTNNFVLITSPDQTDSTPSTTLYTYRCTNADEVAGISTLAPAFDGAGTIYTNTSGQIRTRQSASGASDPFRIVTSGWIDDR